MTSHAESDAHKEACNKMQTPLGASSSKIDEMLDVKCAEEKWYSRQMLLKVLSSVQFLGRQGLPLRGTWCEATGTEEDSHLIQVHKLQSSKEDVLD